MTLSINQMVRNDDPATSLWAAQDAVRASRAACIATADLMNDGVPRIDEEIWQGCRDNDFKKSLPTIQHARLVLSDAQVLIHTGVNRPTSNGSLSREWIKADSNADLSALIRAMPAQFPKKRSASAAKDEGAPPHCTTCTCGKAHDAAPTTPSETP